MIHELFGQLRYSDLEDRLKIGKQILTESEKLETPVPLIEYLKDNDKDIRSFAIQALGKIRGPQVADQITQYLLDCFFKEDDKEIKIEIVISLRDLKTFFALQALLNIAADTQQVLLVRSMAIQSIAFSTLGNVINPLFNMLTKNTANLSEELVDSIFDALEILDTDDKGIVSRLTHLLNSENLPDSVALHAISYLGYRRYEKAIDMLYPFLDSSKRDLRLAAVDAFGCIGDIQVLPKLESMANDSDERVRRSVARVLQKLQK